MQPGQKNFIKAWNGFRDSTNANGKMQPNGEHRSHPMVCSSLPAPGNSDHGIWSCTVSQAISQTLMSDTVVSSAVCALMITDR